MAAVQLLPQIERDIIQAMLSCDRTGNKGSEQRGVRHDGDTVRKRPESLIYLGQVKMGKREKE